EGIQHSRSDGYAEHVVCEREKEILANIAHGGAAEPSRANDGSQVALHQRNSSRFDGDVRARAHRNANIRRRECRRVIDAIARHRNASALRLQPLHHFRFVLRQHFGDHFVDSKSARSLSAILEIPISLSSVWLPTATTRPSTRPVMPFPVSERNSVTATGLAD